MPSTATSTSPRPITVHNNLTRKKEPLKPLEAGYVRMYGCGVTVYDLCHIGHAMQAIFFDVIRSYLRYAGYRVTYVRNFTDVDDKIIDRAKSLGISPAKLADDMIEACDSDLALLGIAPADQQPRVSRTIPQIIAMIEDLIKNKAAYASASGDVYYRVRGNPGYGKLSGRKPDELRSGTRDIVVGDKEDELDFVLWKIDATEGASWDSPWGHGRPGWHIECSAMAKAILGPSFDIHGGGRDLIFPHHENEIAQSESANCVPFATVWMHNGLVTVEHTKMSKSLGNFLTIRDAVKKWPGEALRLNFLSHHYSSNIDFSEAAFLNCHRRLVYIYETLAELDASSSGRAAKADLFTQIREEFHKAMSDDFNTAAAVAAMSKWFKRGQEILKGKKNDATLAEARALVDGLRETGAVLGLFKADLASAATQLKDALLPALNITKTEIEAAIVERTAARTAKDFAKSDALRAQMATRGIDVRDTPQGMTWGIKYSAEDQS